MEKYTDQCLSSHWDENSKGQLKASLISLKHVNGILQCESPHTQFTQWRSSIDLLCNSEKIVKATIFEERSHEVQVTGAVNIFR